MKQFLVILLLLLPGSGYLQAQNVHSVCLVETKEYPGKDYAMWDALYAARNGTVYTGLITEGGSAHFYSWSAAKDQNMMIADIACEPVQHSG